MRAIVNVVSAPAIATSVKAAPTPLPERPKLGEMQRAERLHGRARDGQHDQRDVGA